jgi:outer membrane protein insertion porin family
MPRRRPTALLSLARRRDLAWCLASALIAMLGIASTARADVPDFVGKRLVDVRVEIGGQPIEDEDILELIETRLGEPLSMIDIRETIHHLTGLGRFQDIKVYAEAASGEAPRSGSGQAADGVALRWSLVPVQRLIRVRFAGSPVVPEGELHAALAARPDRTLSAARVPDMIETLERFYADRGYRSAAITSRLVPTDRPDEAEIELTVKPGRRTTISGITLRGTPLESEQEMLGRLHVKVGAPYDRPQLERRMEEYEERLRTQRYYEVSVTHTELISEDGATASLTITFEPGPRVRVVFAGDPLPGRRDDLVPIRQERSVEEDLLEDAVRNIERYLRSEGYRDASVRYLRSEENGELVLTFTVQRGLLHRVASIDLSGASSVAPGDLTPLLKVAVGEPFVADRVNTVASAITELYHVRGFAAAAVKVETPVLPSVTSDGVTHRPVAVRLVVTEGPRTIVGSVALEGVGAIEESRVRALLGLAPDRPFYRPQLTTDRDAIERLYRNEGFQRATVEGQPMLSSDGQRADVRWLIREGQQTRVDHVLVSGNVRTSRQVIRREIVLEPGAPLGEDALVESQRRLTALGLFRRIRITPLPYGVGSNRDVLVDVEEAPSTTLEYGGGLEIQRRAVPGPDGTADDRLDFAPRGFFSIGRRNLWGKNRSLSLFTRVSVRRRDPGVDNVDPTDTGGYGFNEYRLVGTYREPRAFGTAGDAQLTGYLEQAIRSSYSFKRRGLQAEYARRLRQLVTVSGRYSFDRTELFDVKIEPEDQPLIDRLFPQVRLSTVTGSVLRDTRDDVLDPQRGTVVGVDGSVAARALGSEVGFVRSFARAFYYRPLPGTARFVVATGVRVGVARGFVREVQQVDENGDPVTTTIKELPASERFYAGGDTTVRGFALDRLGTDETLDENGFPTGGNGLLVMNVELRTPYWKGLGLVGFLDGGNVFKLASDIDLSEVRGAVGFGIRYRSPLGPLRVDLGFKLDPRLLANGSRERRSVLYVSLGQAF